MKITHPTLVGLLHPEGVNSGRSCQSCISFCFPASHATSAVDMSGCAHKCDTIWVTVTAAPGRWWGPFTCTALRTVYQKHQNSNGFYKDIMKLYEKLEFRVHRASLASGYWRRCSFHCRFLLNFGGVNTSASCTTEGIILFC